MSKNHELSVLIYETQLKAYKSAAEMENFISFQLPYILTSLQKSVQAVLIGKTMAPDWLTHGIRDKCKMMSVTLTDLQALWPSHADLNAYTSLASDGRFIYVFSCHGLVKIGSGYSNTVKVSGQFYKMLESESSCIEVESTTTDRDTVEICKWIHWTK